MKTKTHIKAGAITLNHNETLVAKAARTLKIKSGLTLGQGTCTAALLIAAMLFLGATGLSQPDSSTPSREAPPIGTGHILFGDNHVTPDGFTVRAFVPTDSLSRNCLVTLAESNFAIPGISVFCGPREFEGQKGVLVSAFFPQPIPPGLILTATLYQEHAHGTGLQCFTQGSERIILSSMQAG